MKSKRRNLEIRKTAQQGMQNVLVAKGTGGWVRMSLGSRGGQGQEERWQGVVSAGVLTKEARMLYPKAQELE